MTERLNAETYAGWWEVFHTAWVCMGKEFPMDYVRTAALAAVKEPTVEKAIDAGVRVFDAAKHEAKCLWYMS
jgi:aryl-alcohol dehydrogenase-like predicted oxidoreductase